MVSLMNHFSFYLAIGVAKSTKVTRIIKSSIRIWLLFFFLLRDHSGQAKIRLKRTIAK